MQAAELLAKDGIEVAVINARFIKPLDDELIQRFCTPGAKVITVEEGSLAGGFGSAVMERAQQLGLTGVDFHRIGIPDEYVHHGTQDVLRAQYDLHPEGIARRVREFVGWKEHDTAAFLQELIEIGNKIPDEDLIRMHAKGKNSDRIDEFVYGKPKRATK
jgi:deoxyxylulose-5-phosphate synthase